LNANDTPKKQGVFTRHAALAAIRYKVEGYSRKNSMANKQNTASGRKHYEVEMLGKNLI
jgi:hypothetical protein